MESTSPRLDTVSTLPKGDTMSLAAVISPRNSTGDESTKADEMRQNWLDQMPAHWRTPEHSIEKRVFSSLAFGAVGQSDLTEMWVACRDERTFRAYNERVMKRIATITVVVSHSCI